MMPIRTDVNTHRRCVNTPTRVSLRRPMATTLAERWKDARLAKGLGCNELDRRIGKKALTTIVEAGARPNVALDTVAKTADVLGVRPAWLAFGVGPREGGEEADRIAEFPASTFVGTLPDLPKLVSTVRLHPKKDWKVWHLVSVVQDYLEHPNLANADGDPTRGTWLDVMDEKAGKGPPAKVVGGIDRARRSHRAEHAPKK